MTTLKEKAREYAEAHFGTAGGLHWQGPIAEAYEAGAQSAPLTEEVTDEMVARAWQAFDKWSGYSMPEKIRAALEAARLVQLRSQK